MEKRGKGGEAGRGRSTPLAETLILLWQPPIKSRASGTCQDLNPSNILAHEAELNQKLPVPIVRSSCCNFEQSSLPIFAEFGMIAVVGSSDGGELNN